MLVVGSTGGVGQLVVAKLLDAGYVVRAVSRNVDAARGLFGSQPNLELRVADLRDTDALDASEICVGVDAVVSCTGTTAFPSARWKDDNGPEQTDFVGVRNLVNATRAQSPSCKRFVLVSSIGVERTNQMPFVILNLFGVLKHKRAGELALNRRASRTRCSDPAGSPTDRTRPTTSTPCSRPRAEREERWTSRKGTL